MKILYMMSGFPYPAYGGGALRIMGLVSGAAQAGHIVHILSFGDKSKIASDTPLHHLAESVTLVPHPMRAKVDRLKTLLLSSHADMERRSYDAQFLQVLRKILDVQHFDIVQLQSLEMAVYADAVRTFQPSAKIIYDAYNAEAELQRLVYVTDRQQVKRLPMALYSWVQWRRLRRFEGALCQQVDAVLTVSPDDQAMLSPVAGNTPVYVVNNGIDVAAHAQAPAQKIGLQQPAVVFTGTMDYRPNVDAAVWLVEEILPHLQNTAHIYLVGNRPSARVQALDQLPNVHVTGFVEDVLPYLHESTLFIVPLRVGSGTRLKLLQAMSAGCAIVSTLVGAMGLQVADGDAMRIADSAPDFARAMDDLLQDAAQRQRLAQNGRAFVAQHFDWSVIVPRLLAVYEQLG